jgi:phage/plasmid-associated DNA primase
MADHPIKPTNFRKYAKSPLLRYVLPIIPVGAKLKATSKLTADHLGKIPGLISDNGEWTGFPWQNHVTKQTTLEIYEAWQVEQRLIIPLGLRLGDILVGLDLDIENILYRDLVWQLAEEHFGITPVVRCRDGSIRVVLFYRHKAGTPPIRKFAGAYVDEQGQKQLTEMLGTGQLVVAEGPHFKGKMQYWLDDRELVDHFDEIPEITSEMVSGFYLQLNDLSVNVFGFTKHKLALPTGSNRAAAVSITNLKSPHRASDMDLLARAIRAIDVNDPRLSDYETWCALFRAMWAACGGDRNFYDEHIWPWLAGNSENTQEEMELKLASFSDSQLGAEHVYKWAASFGFTEGTDAIAVAEFEGAYPIPGVDEENGAASRAAEASGDGSGTATPLVPPPGPIPPSDTHWQLAAAFVDLHGHEWRYNTDAKRWFKFDSGVWQPNDTIQEIVGRMLAVLGVQIYQTVNGRAGERRCRTLQSYSTVASVTRTLQSFSSMVVREEDFDAHPHLLNTPGGIVDLRTGAMMDNDPILLLRNITRFAPAYGVIRDYERAMPRFLRVLANVAMKGPDLIPALRAWGAYLLTGELRHQALGFFHGEPGVGKSLIFQVFYDLLHTYSKLLDESFFSKNGGDAKRFDMAALIGKRMAFMDETQLGMTWDETRASKGASAKKLNAELKFGRTVEFANTAKICIVGNHKPNFVAADTGGLTSRMLLFEAGGINYREPKNNGIDKLSDIIVAEEGPAILMWLLEACVADYNTPGLFNELTLKQREAAKAYAKEDSKLRQWVADRMCVQPDLDIDTTEALKSYVGFCKEVYGGKAPNIQLSGFKQALKKAFPSVSFGNRTRGPHPNRACINGLGYPPVADFAEAGNVVKLIQNLNQTSSKTEEGS